MLVATGEAANAQRYRFPSTAAHDQDFAPRAYFNHKTSTNVDWDCKGLTYSILNSANVLVGHKGTDFSLTSSSGCSNWCKMRAGRDVVAAADGDIFLALDGCINDECNCVPGGSCPSSCLCNERLGNYVSIKHRNGRRSIYGHMKYGSIRDEEGTPFVKDQCVWCGRKIGEVASSGYSEAPHIHFEVKESDVAKDPFCGDCSNTCPSWWSDQNDHGDLPGLGCDKPTGQFTDGDYVYVTADGNNARFRNYPGTTGTTVLGTKPAGSIGRVTWNDEIDHVYVDCGGYRWWYVQWCDTDPGWMAQPLSGSPYLAKSGSACVCTAGSSRGVCSGPERVDPDIDSFDVDPSTPVPFGESFEVSYRVSDAGGSGLDFVQLNRTTDVNGAPYEPGWQEVDADQLSGDGPTSGTLDDTPPEARTYWYGLCVEDGDGNRTCEEDLGIPRRRRVVKPLCTGFTISPQSLDLPASAASGYGVNLHGAPDGCLGRDWTTAESSSWFFFSPTSGTGPDVGGVTVVQEANTTGVARSANATVAGNALTVRQAAGASCSGTQLCRAAVGACDVAEFCDDGSCPSDQFKDVGESCTDDENPCTEDECDDDGDCIHRMNSAVCNDGQYCNGPDTCGNEACKYHAGNPCPGPDGDGNCKESCSEAADDCTANDPNGSACNDGNSGTDNDHCESGVCVGGENLCANARCESEDDCHLPGECDPATGNCTSPTKENGASCDDGTFCNGADTCSEGVCAEHAGDPCDGPDGDADCSETCSEEFDECTANDLDGSECNDGDPDSIGDTCANGVCGSAPDRCAEVVCAAKDACHDVGACDAATGECSNPPRPNGAYCPDASLCNGVETCLDGDCVPGEPFGCDDGNQCTLDSCIDPTGCIYEDAPSCLTGNCKIEFGVLSNEILGSLQFTANYETAPGAFTNQTKPCKPLINVDLFAQNNNLDERGLRLGIVSQDGIGTPGVLFECAFSAVDVPPVPGDFLITVEAATDPEGNPSNVTLQTTTSCDIECGNALLDSSECTSNDIAISSITVTDLIDGCDGSLNDTFTFNGTLSVQVASSTRYDVGFFLGIDPETPIGSNCSVAVIPPEVSDVDGDFCGDTQGIGPLNVPVANMTAPCGDDNDDGFLDLKACSSWQVTAAGTCGGPADGFAGSPSQCRCQRVETDLAAPHCENNPSLCDDSNPCTDDVCNSHASGLGNFAGCSFTNNTASCSNGLYCDGPDSCSGGSCSVHFGDPCPGPDGDGDCSEGCSEAADNCNLGDPYGSSCAASVCSVGDTCQFGSCRTGEFVDCDDDDACTLDSCSDLTGCVSTNVESCATVDCEIDIRINSAGLRQGFGTELGYGGATGLFLHRDAPCKPLVADALFAQNHNQEKDFIRLDILRFEPFATPTTVATCPFAAADRLPTASDFTLDLGDSGLSAEVVVSCDAECGNGLLEPGEACDGGDCCSQNCNHKTTGTSCTTDNNVCTTDQCDNAGVCKHTNNTSACNDSVFCNGADTCTGGACAQHSGNPCPGADGDGNCSESCNEVADACTAADPNGTPCSDGAFCNGSDTCQGGTCSQHVGTPCAGPDSDGNCRESCSEGADNCTANDPDESACDDANPCTDDDSCSTGVCSGDPISGCTSTTTTTICVVMCGDTNCDANVTAADALAALRGAVGIADCPLTMCDYNGSGSVTAADALAILRVAVGQDLEPMCPTSEALRVGTTIPVSTTFGRGE